MSTWILWSTWGDRGSQYSSLHAGVICANLGVSVKTLVALFRIRCSLSVRDWLTLHREDSVAAVDPRWYEGMDESLRHLLGEHTADLTDVTLVDIRATADPVNPGPAMFRCSPKTTPRLRT